jgi:hypothetical protein
MKKLLKPAVLAAVTAILVWLPIQGRAQPAGGGGGRGNFDPEAMRQRMMDGFKQALDVQSDDEWKVIEPRVQKVMDTRREIGFGGGMRGMFGGGRRGGGGPNGGGGNAQDDQQPQRRNNFGPQPSAVAQSLQAAIEAKAPADQIKVKLEAVRQERKDKQANLEKAQEDLKKVLNVRQEAAAVLAGLLD